MPHTPAAQILFVCHGNICRSPMAEFVMKDKLQKMGLGSTVHVESAALHRDELGSDIHYGTRALLDAHNIPYEPRQARLVRKADYERFDLIVGMDHHNMNDMRRLFGGDAQGKLSLLMDWVGTPQDVADPWYTGDFNATYDDVDAGCIALIEHLKRSLRIA